jgi:hypothetical protein
MSTPNPNLNLTPTDLVEPLHFDATLVPPAELVEPLDFDNHITLISTEVNNDKEIK